MTFSFAGAAALPNVGRIPFDVEARLLQELGERLVASPEVALLELVKNASDADAPTCTLMLGTRRGRSSLVVADTGVGMSFDSFVNRWMRIATDSKPERLTARFKRPVTGQKGIGRFAVRFLGSAMKLESTSYNPSLKKFERLEAVFDWRKLDRAATLRDAKVAYRRTFLTGKQQTGTTLTVWRLKQKLEEAISKNLRTQVLQIVSPLSAFNAGSFDISATRTERGDPGFTVEFQGFPDIDESAGNIAEDVLKHAWARLTVSLEDGELTYMVAFAGEKKPKKLKIKVDSVLTKGLHADVAFVPRRKGVFLGASVLRTQIWDWVKKNSGIAVIDNGFRISPYGFGDDDWLYLNADGSHNRRDWRSEIAEQNFPLTEHERARPGLNPTLNLPSTTQVIGAVFVASRASDDPEEEDLTPAMDRQGYIDNSGYRQLVDYVRGGLEFLARVDKDRSLELAEEAAEQARLALRSDLAEVAAAMEADPRLSREERAQMVRYYSDLAVRVEKQEDYDRSARQRLEIASGLGVVAGFMTHEAERLFLGLDSVLKKLGRYEKKVSGLKEIVEEIAESRDQLDAYIRYTRLYTDSLRNQDSRPFEALSQINWIEEVFGAIPKSRGILTEVDCADDVMAPAMPVAMYSAVLLNLYTNATKAIIAKEADDQPARILISAWNDAKFHYVTVQDTGAGVPTEARERIWDPFYTTTSRVNSPLGTGMGLGLSLVRDLMGRIGGTAQLATPSPGFVTCVQVRIPRGKNGQ